MLIGNAVKLKKRTEKDVTSVSVQTPNNEYNISNAEIIHVQSPKLSQSWIPFLKAATAYLTARRLYLCTSNALQFISTVGY